MLDFTPFYTTHIQVVRNVWKSYNTKLYCNMQNLRTTRPLDMLNIYDWFRGQFMQGFDKVELLTQAQNCILRVLKVTSQNFPSPLKYNPPPNLHTLILPPLFVICRVQMYVRIFKTCPLVSLNIMFQSILPFTTDRYLCSTVPSFFFFNLSK